MTREQAELLIQGVWALVAAVEGLSLLTPPPKEGSEMRERGETDEN